MKNIPNLSFWRPLDGHAENEFKKWAKDNFDPETMEIFKSWHPITRATCWEMMAEYYAKNSLHSNPGGCNELYHDLINKIIDFMAETKTEEVTILMYLKAIVAHQENQILKIGL